MKTSESLPDFRPSIASQADSLVKTPVQPQPFMAGDPALLARKAASGTSNCESSPNAARSGPSLKTSRASKRGLPKSRDAWRALSTWCPELTSRLGMLVLRIYDGECSLLPTVTARDWRSPGLASHARLQATRGEPLTETIGSRLSPEFCEWMMGFPVGWTDVSE